jgi:hypothetical protein
VGPYLQDLRSAAFSLGKKIQVLNAVDESEIDAAFVAMARQRPDALLQSPDPFLGSRRDQIAGRSRARLAKAASISPIVLALRVIWICSPMVGAACCTSRNGALADEALAGLRSKAIRPTLGTRSRSSRRRLAASSCQVAARPGEAGDKTKLDRVFGDTEDDWDRRCCSFGR